MLAPPDRVPKGYDGGVTRLLIAVLSLSLLGCPPTPGPGGDGVASPSSESVGGTPTPTDPLEGSVFSQEELFEIYAAYQAEDGREVLRKHRLVDAEGKEQPTRVKAFDAALETYAKRDPEGWAAFVESLGR